MKCSSCNNPLVEETVDNYHYQDSILKKVYLSGVLFSKCMPCQSQFVSLPQISNLHETLALAVVSKPNLLASDEISFLIRFIDHDQICKILGVSAATLKHLEEGSKDIDPTMDHFLRTIVMDEYVYRNEIPLHSNYLTALTVTDQSSHSQTYQIQYELVDKKYRVVEG